MVSLAILSQKAEIVISVFLGIILTKVSFATSFTVISYPCFEKNIARVTFALRLKVYLV